MNPKDLLGTARKLVPSSGRPKQSDLMRATSTAYYVLFHTLARNCANTLIGTAPATRSNPAWKQAYRAVEHGATANACKNKHIMQRFPPAIQDFAYQFITMQSKRHQSDYDPNHRTKKSTVEADIDIVEETVKQFESAPIKDRRAFAAYVLLKNRQS